MTTRSKSRQAVRDALNGDYENVDPAVRRALVALAQETDDHSAKVEAAHAEILSSVDTKHEALQKSLNRVQALLITATLTFFTTLVTAVVGMVIN